MFNFYLIGWCYSGLTDESDSDGSDLDDSVLPPTTPLSNELVDRAGKGRDLHQTHGPRDEEVELDDFDFYG